MKHFLLGLLGGALLGVAASFLKDKNGKRIGEPVKDNLLAAGKEMRQLKTGCKHAHRAMNELAQSIPAAEKSLKEIGRKTRNFQIHSQSGLRAMQRQTNELKEKLTPKS